MVRFLGVKLSETTYTSTVLPPLLLVWVLSYLEHFIEKKLPDAAKPLLTPLICFVVMVPATIMVIGPASAITANAIANGYNALVAFAPALAGAIIGGLWQVVVIFGVHWGITPVVLANFDMNGCDTFQAFQTIAVVAQVAAAFGVFIKSRNKEFKGVALSAGVTGIFGITEPTIYGVTLRLKKPFICGCAGGAVGAVVMNRVRSGSYPNTISEVIYQSGQFGPAMTGWLDSVLSSGGYTETAMQAAADALAGSNPIGDCLSFGNGNWGIQIGDHFFH